MGFENAVSGRLPWVPKVLLQHAFFLRFCKKSGVPKAAKAYRPARGQ